MRNFEEDFEFDWETDIKAVTTKACRIDSYRPVTFIPNRSNDPEHEARILAHQERVQREMKELGITKGGQND